MSTRLCILLIIFLAGPWRAVADEARLPPAQAAMPDGETVEGETGEAPAREPVSADAVTSTGETSRGEASGVDANAPAAAQAAGEPAEGAVGESVGEPASAEAVTAAGIMPGGEGDGAAVMTEVPDEPLAAEAEVASEAAVSAGEQTAAPVSSPLKASRFELFAGATLMRFDYAEFDSDGAWLDEETGWLPGMLLGATLSWPGQWYVSGRLDFFSGEVGYQGQTQSADPVLSGLPIVSQADTDIIDIVALLGHRFARADVYAGLGYYFWRRNIQPTTTNGGLPVAGVLEFYSWSYFLLGTKLPLLENEDNRFEFELRLTRMLQAQMEVDFLGYGGYDNVYLNLGREWGLRLALPWTLQRFRPGLQLVVEPYYVRWNLGRSAVSELTINGAGTGSGVAEPRSETANYGISVYLRFLM